LWLKTNKNKQKHKKEQNMNTPNKNEKPTNNMESLKQQAAACDPGCGCHATGTPGKTRWVIGVIVLVAAGVMVVRAAIKSDGSSTQTSAPTFAALATLTGGSGSATNSGTAAATGEKSLEPIGSLLELNTLATKPDAIFVYLPGKEETSATPPLKALQGAARAVEANAGQKCGLFTLKAGSSDYDQIAGKITFPGVLAAVKGRGMVAVSGDITETKLVQGYVAASSAAGCGSSAGAGCCPK
jgi:MYXO-CTERM domain-containing protein